MQCHSRCLVNSSQHFPTSYEGTHACTLGLSDHMAQTHASRLTIFICWAFSRAQVPSEMIILTLPRRKSFWFSLCQRENLFEAKPVDVRLRRNEGREGKSFFRLGGEKATSSDCKTVFSSQTTQRQSCSSSLEGRSDFVSPANHRRSKEENAATNLTNPLKVVWVDAWLVASAAMMTRSAPASQLIWRSTCTTRHERSWARATRIWYGHIQTKLTFICGFSLNPPPPPHPQLCLSMSLSLTLTLSLSLSLFLSFSLHLPLSLNLSLSLSSTDINECITGDNNCHSNSTCTNLVPFFECTCLPGFAGDGVECTGTRALYRFRFFKFLFCVPWNRLGELIEG